MNKKTVIFWVILFIGFDCLGNALHYFISGKSYSNTDLRNYAVVGQIFFALAVIAYGFRYQETYKKID